MNLIIAYILCVIGSFFSVLSDKSNNGRKILIYNGIANVFCGFHYFLLGGISGAITSFAAIVRNITFHRYKGKIPLQMILGYFVFLILVSYTSVTSFLTFIPVSLVIIYTIGLCCNDKNILKACILLTSFLEIIYDIKYKAYVAIGVCIINIILVTISIMKIDRRDNKLENN